MSSSEYQFKLLEFNSKVADSFKYNCQQFGKSTVFDDPDYRPRRRLLDLFEQYKPLRGDKTRKQCWDILWGWKGEAGLIHSKPGISVGYLSYDDCCPNFVDEMTQTVDIKTEQKYLKNPVKLSLLTEEQRDPNFQDESKYDVHETETPPKRFSFQEIVVNVMQMFGVKNKLLNADTLEIQDGLYCYGCEHGHVKDITKWFKCFICNRTYCTDTVFGDEIGLFCDDCDKFCCCAGETYYFMRDRRGIFCDDCAPFETYEMTETKDPVEDVDID